MSCLKLSYVVGMLSSGVCFLSCVGVCCLILSFIVFLVLWCLVLSVVVVVLWCLFFVLSCLMLSFGVFLVLCFLWCPFFILLCCRVLSFRVCFLSDVV